MLPCCWVQGGMNCVRQRGCGGLPAGQGERGELQEAEARVSVADGEGGGYRQAAGDYRVQGCCRGCDEV